MAVQYDEKVKAIQKLEEQVNEYEKEMSAFKGQIDHRKCTEAELERRILSM